MVHTARLSFFCKLCEPTAGLLLFFASAQDYVKPGSNVKDPFGNSIKYVELGYPGEYASACRWGGVCVVEASTSLGLQSGCRASQAPC